MSGPVIPVDGDEQLLATERRRTRQRVRPSLVVAGAWLLLVVVVALLAPVLFSGGPNLQSLAQALQGPSAAHPLGTDALGRDLIVRLAWGARPALLGAVVGLVIAAVLGFSAGLVGGYVRGPVDRVLSGVADVLQAVPQMLVLLIVFAIFGSNVVIPMAVFGIFSMAPLYRISRGATLAISGELYVTAARSAGVSRPVIVARHLAPRLKDLLRVQTSIVGAVSVVTQVGLGFLGFDVSQPTPSWGNVVADATQNLTADPWMLVPPAAVICLTVLALGVLGDVAGTPALLRRRAPRIPSTVRSRTAVAPDPVRQDAGGALLSVRRLTVRAPGGGPVLVDDVSFDVRRGEVLGLVGESGAGKSVTARAVLRLDDAEVDGTVLFDGVDVSAGDDATLRRIRGKRIAYIGQDPMLALDPLFRVESQLIEAVRTHTGASKTEAKAKALDLLRAVRIREPEVVARKRPFEISGGMAQRVAIALALAGDPELLIADEPTTALDVGVQLEVLGLLTSLQQERGLAVILVTHDWGVVADVCDRAVTLYAGEIVEKGAIRDVFSRPAHPYTAALRKSDPHLRALGERLVSITGGVPAPGARPSYCRFADRCPVVIDRCRTLHPVLESLDGPDRAARCIRTEELQEGRIHV